MDFEFTYDFGKRQHLVHVPGEHGALGQFLNAELATSPDLAFDIQKLIDELETNQFLEKSFTEWNLELDQEDIRIFHHSLTGPEQELEQGNNFLQWQFEIQCGKGDLIALLLSWLDFIEN